MEEIQNVQACRDKRNRDGNWISVADKHNQVARAFLFRLSLRGLGLMPNPASSLPKFPSPFLQLQSPGSSPNPLSIPFPWIGPPQVHSFIMARLKLDTSSITYTTLKNEHFG